MATMLPAEFWKCADESRRAIDALTDALGGMKVNASRMAQCANDYWSQASTVVGFHVKEHGMSYRTGHQILALMMQTVADRNIPPSQATPDMLEGAIGQEKSRRRPCACGRAGREGGSGTATARECVCTREEEGGGLDSGS